MKYAKREPAEPSRFLEELPEEGVRREDRRDPRESYLEYEDDAHLNPRDFFRRMKRL